ncbi:MULTISPECIES: hypothetical protein [unclassified Caballeronia]|uniref:hypothetical protein n=1 Tax=unclassified Caballeronia TaxID=2646786 RepID=UPI00286276ED|nr:MULTISPECIES: hypothetical protein [unclassified Caballeronia]MDR5777521.1 hypothetical protein [Caballeronia sp. LZ002]MDR5852973.1 hypothetical protein [Caballeronia sp. LZ003]
MNRNEIVIAIQKLRAQSENLLLTEEEFLTTFNELLGHAQLLDVDDQLKRELIMVRSLISSKRNSMASARLQMAIVATFFRFPPPKPNSMQQS